MYHDGIDFIPILLRVNDLCIHQCALSVKLEFLEHREDIVLQPDSCAELCRRVGDKTLRCGFTMNQFIGMENFNHFIPLRDRLFPLPIGECKGLSSIHSVSGSLLVFIHRRGRNGIQCTQTSGPFLGCAGNLIAEVAPFLIFDF